MHIIELYRVFAMALADFGYLSSTALNFAASHYLPHLHGLYSLTSIPSAFKHRTSFGGFLKGAVKSTAAAGIGWALNRALAFNTPLHALGCTIFAYEAFSMGQHFLQARQAKLRHESLANVIKPVVNIFYNGINIYSIFNLLSQPKSAINGIINEVALLHPGKLKLSLNASAPLSWTKTQNMASIFNTTMLPAALAALSFIYRGYFSYKAANELQRRQNLVPGFAANDKVGLKDVLLHTMLPFAIDFAIIDSMYGSNCLSASWVLTSIVTQASNLPIVKFLTITNNYAIISLIFPLFIMNMAYKRHKGEQSIVNNVADTAMALSMAVAGIFVFTSGITAPGLMLASVSGLYLFKRGQGFLSDATDSALASVMATVGLVAFSSGIITSGMILASVSTLYFLPSGLIYGVGNSVGITSYIDLLIPDFIKEIVSPDFSFRKQMAKLDNTANTPTATINAEIRAIRNTGFVNLADLNSFEKDVVWSCMKTSPAETTNERLARALGAAQKIYLHAAQTPEALTRAVAVAVYLATDDPLNTTRIKAIADVSKVIRQGKNASLDNLLINNGQQLNLPMKVAILCANILRADDLNATLQVEMGRGQYSAGPANENLSTGFNLAAFKTNMDRHFNAVSGHDFARPELPENFQR